MTRAERLLDLMQALRERRGPVTAAALAERCGMSERTIYRDLDALRALGAPVEGEAGVGYVLAPGYFLPPLSLTQGEADAVLLGLRFVMRRGDPGMAGMARTAAAKIGAGLDPEVERRMRGSGLTVGPGGGGHADALALVRTAMEAERKLDLAYRNGAGRESDRVVWPVALGFFDGAEMLAAWCETRGAFRHFRLDRIAAIHVRPERLPTPRRALLARYRLTEPDADL